MVKCDLVVLLTWIVALACLKSGIVLSLLMVQRNILERYQYLALDTLAISSNTEVMPPLDQLPGALEHILDTDIAGPDGVGHAEHVGVLDADKEAGGVVAGGESELFIPGGEQTVVDNLGLGHPKTHGPQLSAGVSISNILIREKPSTSKYFCHYLVKAMFYDRYLSVSGKSLASWMPRISVP